MHKNKHNILISAMSVLTALAGALPCCAEQFSGKVVGVSDGDTITVLCDNKLQKIRLSGIDCPEKSQAFGQQAKMYTSALVFSQDVKVISMGHDRYRRTIGEVYLADGRNLSNLLLENGYAWWYQKYSHDEYRHDLQEMARKSKLGLWTESPAEAPWDFRHLQHN